MSQPTAPTQAPPAPVTETAPEEQVVPTQEPLWRVVLHDDQLHTYEYVIEMLVTLLNMAAQQALLHAIEVDTKGRTVVARLPLAEAERKRDAIMTYGGDPRLRSTISMVASIEPDDG